MHLKEWSGERGWIQLLSILHMAKSNSFDLLCVFPLESAGSKRLLPRYHYRAELGESAKEGPFYPRGDHPRTPLFTVHGDIGHTWLEAFLFVGHGFLFLRLAGAETELPGHSSLSAPAPRLNKTFVSIQIKLFGSLLETAWPLNISISVPDSILRRRDILTFTHSHAAISSAHTV